MPLRLSHKPPEARIWLATIILAPAVPRKVMVSLDGLSSFIANVTIEQGNIFYNLVHSLIPVIVTQAMALAFPDTPRNCV